MVNFQFTGNRLSFSRGLCCCGECARCPRTRACRTCLPHKLVLAQAMVLVVSKALQTRLYCRLLVTQDLQLMVAL